MNKFDLEKALAGEPVVLRNGFKAYVRHRETELVSTPLLMGFYLIGDSFGVGKWAECGANYWSIGETDYEIVGMWIEPPKFEYWHLLNEDIKYIAKDSDGRWFGYKIKPFIGKFKRWDVADHVCYPLSSLNPSVFPDCDWEHSLIGRPENE